MSWFPRVNDGKADGEGCCSSGIVLVPIMRFFVDASRLRGVPDMVTKGAPGVIVCPLTTYCDALLAVKTSLPIVKACFGIGAALGESLPVSCDDPGPRPWFAVSELRSG